MLHMNIEVDEKELQRLLNDELEKMSHEEAKRMTGLITKICAVIEGETDYTYQDVIRALDSIRKFYERNGRDLLNNRSIQEVSRFGALLS